MKYNVKQQHKEFTPIKLELTIESLEELESIMALIYTGDYSTVKTIVNNNCHLKYKANLYNEELFNSLEAIWKLTN